MKLKVLSTLLGIVLCLFVVANTNKDSIKYAVTAKIDSGDTIVFNLDKAIFNGSFIDIPVSIKSNDTVNAIDFSFKFDENELTFDSLIVYKSSLLALANFNLSDRKLRVTSSSIPIIPNDTIMMAVRFAIAKPCRNVSKNDFNTIAAYLNGDGCSYKFTNSSYNAPVADFTFVNACFGQTTNFNDASLVAQGTSIVSWKWNFGDTNTSTQQNPANAYASLGNYAVSLIVTSNSGCKDTIIKTVSIHSLPVVNFSSLIDCGNDTVFFTDNSNVTGATISEWSWSFGDNSIDTVQNPAHVYQSGGIYMVSLTATSDSGCSAIDSAQITIANPITDFFATGGCAGTSITFSDSSATPVGIINSWQWYFGDGNTDSIQNPSHSYTAAGTYTVSLVIDNNQSCSDSITKIITIDAKPVVKFSADVLAGCGPLTVVFTDSSTIAAGSSYFWSFGDGDTLSVKDTSHIYTSGGIYTVKHIVTTATGCTDSLIKTNYINVYDTPIANFDAAGACVGTTTIFNDSSIITSGTISEWDWNFGDSNIDSIQQPSHSYTNAGSYSVTLIVTSDQSCTDTATKTISIDSKPILKFSADKLSGCEPLAVLFADSSNAPIGSTYHWSFGDTNTSTIKNPAHTYISNGVYTVKQVVTSSSGCSDSLIKTNYINVYDSPTADFVGDDGCSGSAILFTDSSKISSGSITGWSWTFGDGGTATTTNPSHTYTTSGTYSVTLIATNNQNCKDTIQQTVTIESKPAVNFGADILSGCSPLIVDFTDSSTTVTGSTYIWNFGVGSATSTSKNPSYTYSTNGTYSVELIVTTPAGCKDSLTKNSYITVSNSVNALFSLSPDTVVLPEAEVEFTNQSTGYTSLLWNFGDSTLSTLSNPKHTYEKKGKYQVCLTVQSSAGCADTHCDTVYVIKFYPVVVPPAFSPNGDLLNDILRVKGGPLTDMEWRIFNEWGKEIFYSDNQSLGWDGEFNGVPQPVGVYEYTLKGKIGGKKSIKMHGIINLVR